MRLCYQRAKVLENLISGSEAAGFSVLMLHFKNSKISAGYRLQVALFFYCQSSLLLRLSPSSFRINRISSNPAYNSTPFSSLLSLR